MAKSPTERVLQRLRDRGYLPQVVERWNPFARVRVDLFGCIDLVALSPAANQFLVGVQATSVDNMSSRRKKSLGLPFLKRWLETGAEFWVFGASDVSWRIDRAKVKGKSVIFDTGLTFADIYQLREDEGK